MTGSSFIGRLGRLALVAVTVLTMLSALFVAAPKDASAAAALHYLYGSGSATGGKVITFRIELTEPAPAGGALVTMSASSPLVPVPPTVLVPAGSTVKTIQFRSVPTPITRNVTVSASYKGVTKSRVHTVIEPFLSSMSVQSVMRAGGQGRILVRISGRAYAGGVDIRMTSNRSSVVAVPPVVHIPEGRANVEVIVSPTYQLQDVPVTFTANYDHRRQTGHTIVRWFSSTFTATPTNTATATLTATNTATATQTATETATNTPVDTATNTPVDTVTNTPVDTATNTPVDTATNTPVDTATNTPVDTATNTPTDTATATATNTVIPVECANPFSDVTAAVESGDRYTTTGSNGYAGCDFTGLLPSGGVYASQITDLGFSYDFELGNCGAGSPRFSAHITGIDTYIYIVPGTTVPLTDCGDNGDTGNLMATTGGNCMTANVPGGTTYDNCQNLETVLAGNKIDELFFVIDVSNGPQTLLSLPRVTINPVGPTSTNTPVDTATNTPVDTATNTPVDTATNTPTDTATNTPVDTATATSTPLPVVECANPFGDVTGHVDSGDLYRNDGANAFSACMLYEDPSGGVVGSQISNISTTWNTLLGDCGVGTPRFSMRVNNDPNKNIFVYIGVGDYGTGCGAVSGDTGNLIASPDMRCDISQLGTVFGAKVLCSQLDAVLEAYSPGAKITRISLVMDASAPPQQMIMLPSLTLGPPPTPTNTPVDTATNTATNTPVDTATNTPTDTATNTPVDTATNTPTNTATATTVPPLECVGRSGGDISPADEPGDRYTNTGPEVGAYCEVLRPGVDAPIYASQIDYLGFTLVYESGNCGAGDPRFSVHVEGAGDSGWIYVVPGFSPGFNDCSSITDTGNLMATTDGNCNTANLPGGTTYDSCAALGDFLGDQKIDQIFLISDGSGVPQTFLALPTLTIGTTLPTATNTATPTNTPTDTPTNTPVPPTATSTNTPVPPTATPTNIPTNTPTNTATNTPTNTPVPPTNTPVPPTPTNTPVPQTFTVSRVGFGDVNNGGFATFTVCKTGGALPYQAFFRPSNPSLANESPSSNNFTSNAPILGCTVVSLHNQSGNGSGDVTLQIWTASTGGTMIVQSVVVHFN